MKLFIIKIIQLEFTFVGTLPMDVNTVCQYDQINIINIK